MLDANPTKMSGVEGTFFSITLEELKDIDRIEALNFDCNVSFEFNDHSQRLTWCSSISEEMPTCLSGIRP